MNILQIGAGFIGSKLEEKLKANGNSVEVIDIVTTGHDITNRDQISNKIMNGDWDAVILLAAIANLNDFEKNPLKGMDVNIGGVINVANACMLSHTKLYYISTCCVYGNTKDLPSNEEARVEPSEIYACAKLAGEWIIKGYNRSYDLEYVILRIATCYGPGMRAALAPAVFINQAMSGGPITIHGDGKQTRTLTYIDDEVEGISTVIFSGVTNETFNISSEDEISVNYMAQIIKEETGKKVNILNIPDRKGQTFVEKINTIKVKDIRLWKGRYCPDPGKAKRVAGWQAKISFREGIKKTLAWMQGQKLEEIK